MAVTRCECGHAKDGHHETGYCRSRSCACSNYKFSESKTFGSLPNPKFILSTVAAYADRAVVTVPHGTEEATINPDATDAEIRLALKTCAIQLCKLNRILSEFGLPTLKGES